jgi:hypothetical protein
MAAKNDPVMLPPPANTHGDTRHGAFGHLPVLLDEVLHWLEPRPGGLYCDATVGRHRS